MRKAALIVGIVSLVLCTIGILLKILHLPGGGITVILGILTTMLVFLPLLMIYRLKNDKTGWQKATAIIGFVIGFLFVFPGLMFSIQRWPGGTFITYVGGFLGVVFLIMFALARTDSKKDISPLATFNLIVIILLGMLFTGRTVLIGQRAKLIERSIEHYDSTLVRESLVQHELDKQFGDFISSADSSSYQMALSLHHETSSLLGYMKQVKTELISHAMGFYNTGYALLDTLDPHAIERPSDYDTPTHYMIGIDPARPDGKAKDLKDSIQHFYSRVISPDNSNRIHTESVFYDIDQDKNVSWEWFNFYHKTIIESLNNISEMEISVMKAEQETLQNKKFVTN